MNNFSHRKTVSWRFCGNQSKIVIKIWLKNAWHTIGHSKTNGFFFSSSNYSFLIVQLLAHNMIGQTKCLWQIQRNMCVNYSVKYPLDLQLQSILIVRSEYIKSKWTKNIRKNGLCTIWSTIRLIFCKFKYDWYFENKTHAWEKWTPLIWWVCALNNSCSLYSFSAMTEKRPSSIAHTRSTYYSNRRGWHEYFLTRIYHTLAFQFIEMHAWHSSINVY